MIKPRSWAYMIPGPPITKKNSQQIVRAGGPNGRPFLKQGKRYLDYESRAAYFLSPKPPEPIAYPCRVTCVYYMDTRRRVDLTNLMAATHDILTLYRIIADDNRDIVASVDGSRVYYDKMNPRVEVFIEPLDEAVEAYEQWKKEKKDAR